LVRTYPSIFVFRFSNSTVLAILAETRRASKSAFDISGPCRIWSFHHFDWRLQMGSTLKDLIRGDLPLARWIFNDPRKRRLIPALQRDGWPIFDLAGKRAAFPADLAAHMRKATRSGPKPRGGAKTRGVAKTRMGRPRKAKATALADSTTEVTV
jgi:hypothetical protein